MMMMITPAMTDRMSKYSAIVLPMTLAVAPSATNTVVKPSTKASAETSTRRRCAAPGSSAFNSSKLTPASHAR